LGAGVSRDGYPLIGCRIGKRGKRLFHVNDHVIVSVSEA